MRSEYLSEVWTNLAQSWSLPFTWRQVALTGSVSPATLTTNTSQHNLNI